MKKIFNYYQIDKIVILSIISILTIPFFSNTLERNYLPNSNKHLNKSLNKSEFNENENINANDEKVNIEPLKEKLDNKYNELLKGCNNLRMLFNEMKLNLVKAKDLIKNMPAIENELNADSNFNPVEYRYQLQFNILINFLHNLHLKYKNLILEYKEILLENESELKLKDKEFIKNKIDYLNNNIKSQIKDVQTRLPEIYLK